MRWRRWIALVALLLPVSASTQSVVQDGQSTRGVQQSVLGGHLVRADSTQDANTGDGSGNLYVIEAVPDRSFLKKYPGLIQNTLYHTYSRLSSGVLKGPQADSSSAKDVLGAKHLALGIGYSLDADSTAAALLMVEVRGHLTQNTDSINTFAWRGFGQREIQAPTAVTAWYDTIGDFAERNSSALTDTVNAVYGERPIWLNRTNPFRYVYVPLTNPNSGEWFSAPFVSVRVRVIRTYGGTGITAYTGVNAPPTTVNIDLLGWR